MNLYSLFKKLSEIRKKKLLNEISFNEFKKEEVKKAEINIKEAKINKLKENIKKAENKIEKLEQKNQNLILNKSKSIAYKMPTKPIQITPTMVVEPIKLAPIKYESKRFKWKPQGTFKTIPDEIKRVNEKFPLITLDFNGKEYVMCYGNIRWNDEEKALVYYVYEPKLDEKEKKIFDEVSDILKEKLDIDFSKIKKEEAFDYIRKKFRELIKSLGYKINEQTLMKLEYYIYRDFIGLERIEPLMHDKNIEDISCDGAGIPIFIYHRNPLYGEMRTNIMFETKEELDSFVLKLAQRCGRTLSIAEPLLDGALPDGSRVQATLGTDIAMKGSNFTIRKFTEEPFTPIHLMKFGTASAEIFAYLWMAVESGLSILVSGATATGKTTFLNALSLFIKPELKIISIEDTPELRLPHPNWIPEVARMGFNPKGYGEVTMFDLLRAALRQRPDYIIVGEVRGREAYVMFQGIATGHPALGTIHADSLPAIIDRLTTKPIDLPKAMLENLDIIVFLVSTRKQGRYIRRVKEIVEILGYDYNKKDLITNVAFTWDPAQDTFHMLASYILDKIRLKLGLSREQVIEEFKRRIKVLEWMEKNNILNYRDVAKYIAQYYSDPLGFMEMVENASIQTVWKMGKKK